MRKTNTLKALSAIVLILISALGAYQFWIFSLTRDTAVSVRPALRSVFGSYYISKISGDYWENELEAQAKTVKLFPQRERLDFYRAIMLNCEMETTKAMVFDEHVKPDAVALRDDLIRRMRAGQFADSATKRRINDWIDDLQTIADSTRSNRGRRGVPY